MRISEQSDVALQEAVAKKETGGAEHEFTKVTIARSKVDQLRAEAEECIGQLAFRTDENLNDRDRRARVPAAGRPDAGHHPHAHRQPSSAGEPNAVDHMKCLVHRPGVLSANDP